MKSYNGLYNKMIEIPEIELSIDEAAQHKKKKPVVASVLKNKTEKAEEIQVKFIRGEWNPPRHKKHLLQEGAHKKTREIVKPRWDDEQIVHHMLVSPAIQGVQCALSEIELAIAGL